MLYIFFIAAAAHAVSSTPVQSISSTEWNPLSTQLLTQRSSVPVTTFQQIPTTSFQQVPAASFQQTPAITGHATHLLAVPVSRDLTSGFTNSFYQQSPQALQPRDLTVGLTNTYYQPQAIQARDLTSGVSSAAGATFYQQPAQVIAARNLTSNIAPAATFSQQTAPATFSQQTVQAPLAREFTSSLSQMPMSTFNQMPMSTFSQMPMANAVEQTIPVSRQATLLTDNFNGKVETPANRNIAINPENVKILGHNATITWIAQDDGTSLLLINNTHKHSDLHHTVNWTAQTATTQNATVAKLPTEVTRQKASGFGSAPLVSSSKWANDATLQTTSGFAAVPVVSAIPKVSAVNATFIQTKPIVEFQAAKPSLIASSWKDSQLGVKPIAADWGIQTDSNKAYVFDFLAPPVTSSQLVKLVAEAVPGKDFPALTVIPETTFTCDQKKIAGYFADIETACQVFRRCDTEGKKTDYLCPEKTVFNQVTLNCDWWFNVDCPSSPKFEHYANSRLYTDLPLFDTPPSNYVPKWAALYFDQLHNERKINDAAIDAKRFIIV